LVESPDGDVQSYPVDPALPLRDTLLCHDLPPGWHLRLDGDRLDTAQSARDLGLEHGAVLQSFAPQTGGGDEEGNGLLDELLAEHQSEQLEPELELERSRRRQRAAVESGGATNEGSPGERPARRLRQRVESEDKEWEGDEWEGDESEGDESDGDGSDDGADEDDAQHYAQRAADRQALQERQKKAKEASARAAKFQEQQRDRVHAPAIADSGVQPWDGVSVEVAQLNESKVRYVTLTQTLNQV